MTKKLIIDCDPGIDDAVAIALCCASDELDLLGITTTHGNVALERTTINALALLDILDQNISVYAGTDRPLVRPAIHASNVHGASGFGGVKMPVPNGKPADLHAVSFIIDSVMTAPGEISLFGIGPLTNIALAMRLEPRLAQNLREIVIMGGAIGEGNTTPAAEFNMVADPHAARMVFEAGCPVTMFGLDVTHKVIATPDRVAALEALGSPIAQLIARLIEAYRPSYTERYGWDGAAIHDMCTIAWAIDPTLFSLTEMAVLVDVNEGPNFGRTVCDSRKRDPSQPIVNVARDVDADRVFALLTERIARY